MTDVVQSEVRSNNSAAPNNSAQRRENPSEVFGKARELKDSGFKPMPDQSAAEDATAGDALDVAGAAGDLAEARNSFQPILPRAYMKADGEGADPNEAISLERAAHDLTKIRTAEKSQRGAKAAKATAAKVDAVRAATLGKDQATAEFYGVDGSGKSGPDGDTDGKPNAGVKAEVDAHQKDAAMRDAATQNDTGRARLAPEVEQALRHPQVRQAIAEHLDAAEHVRTGYTQALTAAADVTRAAFLDQFPELAGMSPQQMPAALAAMAQHDPQRFSRVKAMVERVAALEASRAQEHQRNAANAQQQFKDYARAEDVRFDKMISHLPKEMVARAADEILNAAEEYGYNRARFLRMMQTNPTLRSAPIQKMMLDAAAYRLAQKAAPAAIPKAVPPVQRPGTAPARGERGAENLRTLATRFSGQPTLKNAADFLTAHRRSQGR